MSPRTMDRDGGETVAQLLHLNERDRPLLLLCNDTGVGVRGNLDRRIIDGMVVVSIDIPSSFRLILKFMI